jgi:hypothetical protein
MKTVSLVLNSASKLVFSNAYSIRLTKDKLEDMQINYLSSNFGQEMIKNLLFIGFTRANLAVSLSISKSTINNILTGKIKTIRPRIFSNLLRFYCANCLL